MCLFSVFRKMKYEIWNLKMKFENIFFTLYKKIRNWKVYLWVFFYTCNLIISKPYKQKKIAERNILYELGLIFINYKMIMFYFRKIFFNNWTIFEKIMHRVQVMKHFSTRSKHRTLEKRTYFYECIFRKCFRNLYICKNFSSRHPVSKWIFDYLIYTLFIFLECRNDNRISEYWYNNRYTYIIERSKTYLIKQITEHITQYKIFHFL